MCESCFTPTEVTLEADRLVAAGIEWLNANGPADWREILVANLDVLDIWSGRHCVAGLVFADKVSNPEYTFESDWDGEYREFINGWYYFVRTYERTQGFDGAELGFQTNGYAGAADLTAAWRRALTV